MEVASLVLEYIKALIWPFITLLAIYKFRDSLKELLSRLKKADLPGDLSFNFSEQLIEARQLSKKIEETPEKEEHKNFPSIPLTEANARLISLDMQPSPSGLDMNYYRDLTKQDPNIALAGLGIEADILAKNLAKGFNISISEHDNGLRLLRRLYEEGAIYKEQMQLAQKVLDLCNIAIHGKRVSQAQALQVIDFMEVLRSDYIRWLSWGFKDNWNPKEPNS